MIRKEMNKQAEELEELKSNAFIKDAKLLVELIDREITRLDLLAENEREIYQAMEELEKNSMIVFKREDESLDETPRELEDEDRRTALAVMELFVRE